MFFVTLAYEVDPKTPVDAQRLLRAELVGRRYFEAHEGKKLPAHCLWAPRSREPGETVDHVSRRCEAELVAAVSAVRKMGFKIRVPRAFIQVTGAGTFGVFEPPDEI